MKISIAVSDGVTANLKMLSREYPKQVSLAIGYGLLALWQDVLTVAPIPHILTGYTRGSIGIFAGGSLVNESAVSQGEALAEKNYPKMPRHIRQTMFDGTLVVNSPYAARLHELPPTALGPRSKKDGNVGPKFVEAKLSNGRKYAKLIADRLRQLLSQLPKEKPKNVTR